MAVDIDAVIVPVDANGESRDVLAFSNNGDQQRDLPTLKTIGEATCGGLLQAFGALPTDSSDQLGVQCYLGIENLGDRAVFLGVSRHCKEFGFVEIRRFGAQSQSGAGDAETLAFRFEGHCGLGGKFGRGEAGLLHPEGKRHSEAAGMRCGDQLFGVRPLLIFEASSKRVGCFCQNTGIAGKTAATGASGATPNRFRLADHGSLRPGNRAIGDPAMRRPIM